MAAFQPGGKTWQDLPGISYKDSLQHAGSISEVVTSFTTHSDASSSVQLFSMGCVMCPQTSNWAASENSPIRLLDKKIQMKTSFSVSLLNCISHTLISCIFIYMQLQEPAILQLLPNAYRGMVFVKSSMFRVMLASFAITTYLHTNSDEYQIRGVRAYIFILAMDRCVFPNMVYGVWRMTYHIRLTVIRSTCSNRTRNDSTTWY